MRLSCTDATFPFLSHGAALHVIRDLGPEHVDMCAFAEGSPLTLDDVLRDPDQAAWNVRTRVDTAELAIADVFAIMAADYTSLAPNHPDPRVRELARRRFEDVVAFSAALHSPGLTVLPGTTWEGEDPSVSLERAGAELCWRVEYADEHGVALSIEPHVGSLIESVAVTQHLLDLVPGLMLTLDPSHFVYHGVSQAAIDSLLERTRHLQLRQASVGRLQTLLGEGVIDLGRLVAELGRRGYEGLVSLEYGWSERLDCNRVDCIAETAKLRRALEMTERTVAAGAS